jgi:SAM-dependent methyltransferase
MKNAEHDSWSAGENYDGYMGRWSSRIASKFVTWLDMPAALDWLEVGCGTGALSARIVESGRPKSLVCLDQSPGFVDTARRKLAGTIATVEVGDAQNLAYDDDSVDCVVSALVLNFIPDQETALREMCRVTGTDGVVAFYVWDYAGHGVDFMHAFWQAAIVCDPAAAKFAEDKRFPECTERGLRELAARSGLRNIKSSAIETPSIFKSFTDLWRPFTLGAGPAPGYCAALTESARERLKQTLQESLVVESDGSIEMNLRAWAIRGNA